MALKLIQKAHAYVYLDKVRSSQWLRRGKRELPSSVGNLESDRPTGGPWDGHEDGKGPRAEGKSKLESRKMDRWPLSL